MSQLKGACIIGQSGGPTSVINASAYGVIRTALDNPDITAVYGAAHGIKGVLNDQLYDMGQEDAKELELLYHLASTPNRVYTRNQLLDEVWGFDYFGDSRTVDVHIKRLREKVEGVSDQWALKTVWGVGYKFETVGGQTADKAK